MTPEYIESNFSDILKFESVIENRITTDINKAELLLDNKKNLRLCNEYGLEYILIDKNYDIDIEL